MFRKLQEKYQKLGLTLEFVRVEDIDQSDLDIDPTKMIHYTVFKYLGNTLSSNGRNFCDIVNTIGKENGLFDN